MTTYKIFNTMHWSVFWCASSILNHRPELHRILCNSGDNTINGSISDPVPVLYRVLNNRYRAPYFFYLHWWLTSCGQ